MGANPPIDVLYWQTMDIEQRNRLRSECGLPLLDVASESRRLAAVRKQAEFEREWARRRHEFAHHWIGHAAGWLTNMGRWSLARHQVRCDMKKELN